MPTYLDVKMGVANNLGKTDGTVYNTKRESAINRARRKYYSEIQWSFLQKVNATITLTAGLGSMPTDYNDKYNPVCVYTYNGNVKYQYRQVEWSDLASYGTLDYVFALDAPSGTIKISQDIASVTMDYTYLPLDITVTDGSKDTDKEPAQDTTAIELLATAYFFMASRQSKSSYAQFLDGYREQLQLDKQTDASGSLPRFYRNPVPYINKGYQSLY